MKIEVDFSLRKNAPDKFWGELSASLLGEYCSVEFLSILRNLAFEARDVFRKKRDGGDELPYHYAYYVQDDNLMFRYFVQMTAQSDWQVEMPLPIITGILPFPGERCYTFHIHDNGQGIDEVDVFSPHMIERYASRAFRLSDDLPSIPLTWHKGKRDPKAIEFNKKEVKKLFYLVGKFFARNKINTLYKNEKALSLNEQGVNREDYVCLWMDGDTICESFCNGNVWLHKTFLPYWRDAAVKDDAYLGEDQMKAVAGKLANLYKMASGAFPIQYGNVGFDCSQFMGALNWLVESVKSISSVQEKIRPFIERWRDNGLISVTDNGIPQFKSNEHIAALTMLNGLMSRAEDNVADAALAKSVLVVWSSFRLHIRDFDIWNKENVPEVVFSEPEGMQVIRLMRGTNLCQVILTEGELLSKTHVELNKLMSNK